jgi:hypothetical protein
MAALGLLLLAAAGLVAIVGVLGNSGADHLLTNGFAIFGYRVHGSSGRLFLYGAAIGAVAMLGLNMLLAGLGRGFPPGGSSGSPAAPRKTCRRSETSSAATSGKSGSVRVKTE